MAHVSEKHAKFRELAENRTNRALDSLRTIRNLSNHHLYEWDEAEIRKIVKVLKDAVSEIERKFAAPKISRERNFKL